MKIERHGSIIKIICRLNLGESSCNDNLIIFDALKLLFIYRYSIAVSLQHVPAILPYISDTGVLVPERSVFSQLINTAVIVQLLTFYVRFEQLKMAIIQTSRSMTALISDPTYVKAKSR